MARNYKTGIVITGDAKGGVQAINLTRDQLKDLNSTGKRVAQETGSAFDRLKDTLFSVQGIVAGLSGGAFAALISSAVQATNETRRFSDALGVPIERLSAMQYAVAGVGIQSEKLGDILKDTAEKIGDAYLNQGGEAKEALDNLGLSAAKLAAKNPADQLLAIAGALGRVQTQGEKIQILESLANDASLLLPLLEDNAAGLRRLMDEADSIGAIITPEDARVAQEYAANIREMQALFSELGRVLAIEFLPAFSSVIEGFNEFVSSTVLPSIRGFFDDVRTTAEWAAALSMGHISFMEWLTADVDDAAKRLAELKKEMGWVTDEVERNTDSTEKNTRIILDNAKAREKAWEESRKDQKALIAAGNQYLAQILDEQDKLFQSAAAYEERHHRMRHVLDLTGEYSDEIAKLNQRMDEEYQVLLKLRDENAAAEAAKKAAEEAAAEWQRTADTIEQSLTDALLRGFEDGKGFAENFRDTLENMFKTLVLRPVIQAIVQPVGNSIATAIGGGGSSGIGDIVSGVGNLLGLGGSGFSSALGTAASTGLSTFLPAGGAYGSAFGVGGSLGTSFAGSSGGFLSTVSSALPYVGLAMGAVSLIAGLLEKDPDPRFTAAGPMGGASISGLQEVESTIAQRFVDTLNEFETAFLGLLTKAERDAIADYSPDLAYASGMISAHGDAGTENELSQVILTRMTMAMRQLDGNIADAMREGTLAIKGTREFKYEDVQAIVDEILAPILVIRETLDRYFGGIEGYDNIADVAQGIMAGAESLQAYVTGMQTFMQAFYSEQEQFDRATESLTESLQALGIDAIPQSRTALRQLVEGLDLSTEAGQQLHGAIIALVPELAAWYSEAERLGVIAADTALSIANNADQLENLMQGVEDQFASLTLTPFQQEMREIDRWLRQTTESAEALGASTEQLALIQQTAALRVQQAVDGLRAEIAQLVGDLYGGTQETQLAGIEEAIQLETQRISERQAAAEALYRTEMQRYEDSQRAAERIDTYLSGLAVGNLSVLTPRQKLDTAQADFQTLLARAQGGDTDALSRITEQADAYLSAGRNYYASGDPYTQIYSQVTGDLESLAVALGAIDQPADPGSTTTSSLLQSLEARRQQIISQQERENRQALAEELAERIGDLGLALDDSVWDLLQANGISLRRLATDYGLVLGRLDGNLVDGLKALKDDLHVDFLDLAGRLGVDITGLARQFGFDVAALGDDLDNWLMRAAQNIGSDLFDLADALNVDLNHLGDLIADELQIQIDPLGSDIRTQLAPYLTDIRNASDTAQMETALASLRQVVDGLPPDQAAALRPYLDSITTAEYNTAAKVVGQNPYLAYLGNMNNVLNGNFRRWGQTAFNTKQIAEALGKVGYYATGSAGLESDQFAFLHKGEKVIDPASASILDRYGIQVHGGAANDELIDEVRALRHEVAELRRQQAREHAGDQAQRSDIAQAQHKQARDLANSRPVANTRKIA